MGKSSGWSFALVIGALWIGGCGGGSEVEADVTGGAAPTGGAAVTGGAASGGAASTGGAGQPSGGSGGSDGVVGAPAMTELVEGGDQTAPVDTAVPIAPRLRVRDADGDPVPGVAVEFYVAVGGGSVTGAEGVTGADGTIAVGSWVLGPTPGPNELVGEAPGLAPVRFLATAVADERGSLVIVEGDGEYATVGTSVSVAPAVRLLDADGVAVVGGQVLFEVTEGGGSVQGGAAVTDVDGVARVDGWVLGPTPGENSLTASAEGLPSVTFRAVGVSADDPVLQQEVHLGGLDVPWDLDFGPDGSLYFTERGGRVRVLRPAQTAPDTIATLSDASPEGQSGVLGLAVDPDFDETRALFVYTSSDWGGAMDNRVRRFVVAEDGLSATETGDILSGIPWGAGGSHSGGRLRFGPDGHLYVTTGDNRSATIPQDLTSLGSKVLRITKTGAPAPGNPALGAGARPEIFAYGFRNPQGLAIRPGSGQLFSCEHGPNQDDEVTLLGSGGNGGWNPNDGFGNYNGYTGAIMTDIAQFPDAMLPSFSVSDSEGMSGCDFVVGPEWKSWDGRLVVTMLGGRRLVVAALSGDGRSVVAGPENHLVDSARLRVARRGPDGALYVLVDEGAPNGAIWRITPS